MKSLNEQVADLQVSKPQDYDPEEDYESPNDGASNSSDEKSTDGEIGGREHYEEVSKSKIRKPEQPVLGKQYSGAIISRDALDVEEDPFAAVEEEDDPFGKPNPDSGDEESSLSIGDELVNEEQDSEIDSDEAFGSDDEEKFKHFKFLGSKSAAEHDIEQDDHEDEHADESEDERDSDFMEEDTEDVNTQDVVSMSESDGDGMFDDDSGSQSVTSAESPLNGAGPSLERDRLKALLSNDAAAVASTLFAAANADVQKGKAVKRQYQTFDRILDARIKLQKGLTASNSLVAPVNSESDVAAAIQAAEEAALRLFSTIDSLRHSIAEAQQISTASTNLKKRKRPSPATAATSTSSLWKRIESLESASLEHRRAVLNKWSAKTRAATSVRAAPRSQLLDRNHQADQNTITSVLDSYMASEGERLVAASSSTAVGTSLDSAAEAPLYGDSTFYQSLLRDLISSRASLSQTSNPLQDIPLPSVPKQHRKNVDTKASKGRKVRYTVHEKLQNFAAEEDRSTWTDAARVEFFNSLFGGQGKALDENVDVDGEMNDAEEGQADEGVLRLFRS